MCNVAVEADMDQVYTVITVKHSICDEPAVVRYNIIKSRPEAHTKDGDC